MSGALPPLPLYVFMACTGTALPLPVCSADICHITFEDFRYGALVCDVPGLKLDKE